MKKVKIFFIILVFITSYSLTAQVAVNNDGSSADASSILDVKSSSKGFLPPRMTETERDAISHAADGLMLFNTTTKCLNFFVGGFWYEVGDSPDITTVTNATTGKTWMDRNLGANRVALGSSDAIAYGSLYQWGRLKDGHEIRVSSTTTTLSTTDEPGHSGFIISSSTPYDWIDTQNDNLWQGEGGTNNPCPKGFRLPTITEWQDEVATWVTDDADGAFQSDLKLTLGGYRTHNTAYLSSSGTYGTYWSSTIDGTEISNLFFCCSGGGGVNTLSPLERARGLSVRCIKD